MNMMMMTMRMMVMIKNEDGVEGAVGGRVEYASSSTGAVVALCKQFVFVMMVMLMFLIMVVMAMLMFLIMVMIVVFMFLIVVVMAMLIMEEQLAAGPNVQLLQYIPKC